MEPATGLEPVTPLYEVLYIVIIWEKLFPARLT